MCPSFQRSQSPCALPGVWAESAISQSLPSFPGLCLISYSALSGWETGTWQEGGNSQFNWVLRTKAAVAVLSFRSWLTSRQLENLPSHLHRVKSPSSQASVSLNMEKPTHTNTHTEMCLFSMREFLHWLLHSAVVYPLP